MPPQGFGGESGFAAELRRVHDPQTPDLQTQSWNDPEADARYLNGPPKPVTQLPGDPRAEPFQIDKVGEGEKKSETQKEKDSQSLRDSPSCGAFALRSPHVT